MLTPLADGSRCPPKPRARFLKLPQIPGNTRLVSPPSTIADGGGRAFQHHRAGNHCSDSSRVYRWKPISQVSPGRRRRGTDWFKLSSADFSGWHSPTACPCGSPPAILRQAVSSWIRVDLDHRTTAPAEAGIGQHRRRPAPGATPQTPAEIPPAPTPLQPNNRVHDLCIRLQSRPAPGEPDCIDWDPVGSSQRGGSSTWHPTSSYFSPAWSTLCRQSRILPNLALPGNERPQLPAYGSCFRRGGRTVAQFDPARAAALAGPMVRTSYPPMPATVSGSDSAARLRSFDPCAGHSWASGPRRLRRRQATRSHPPNL